MALEPAPAFVWGAGGAQMTPDQIAVQRKIAQAMIQRGSDYSPIQSPWQGAARVAEAMMGGLEARKADEASLANAKAESDLLSSVFSPTAAAPAATPTAATAGPSTIPAGKDEFINTVMPLAVDASAKTGVDPRIIVAQAAIESGWGKHAPGNNLFGIKSHGQPGGNTLPTTEVVNGQPVRTTDSFRAYASPADSVAGYADFINSNPRYAALKGAQGLDAQVAALGASGYATDPAYGAKVGAIARSLPVPGGAAPVPAPAQPTAAPVPAATAPAAGVQPAATPAAAPQAAPSGVNPRLLAAMASPYVSDSTKKVLGVLLERQLNQDKVSTVDLGNSIGVMDARGNIVRTIPKGEPNKGPEYGVIGKDPFGNEQYGWRDPRTQTVTPFTPQGSFPGQPVTITGPDGKPVAVPPGQDPKVFREAISKRGVEGALPASDESTSKLRKEVQDLPSYKNVAQAAPVYKSMLEAAGRDNRAADVNLIYGMAKIMDPGSVVREGEMTIAQAIATLPQQLRATIQSQLTGDGRLSPEVRAAIMQEARGRIGAYQSMFDQDMSMYRGIAQRGRMNEADVIPSFGPFEDYKPPAPVANVAQPATPPSATPQPAPSVDPAALAEARRRGLIK